MSEEQTQISDETTYLAVALLAIAIVVILFRRNNRETETNMSNEDNSSKKDDKEEDLEEEGWEELETSETNISNENKSSIKDDTEEVLEEKSLEESETSDQNDAEFEKKDTKNVEEVPRHAMNVETKDLENSGEHILPLLRNCGKDLVFDEKNLEKLLMNDEVRDTKVCVISIAGALRMGKSFMLNLMLTYFEKKGWEAKPGNWLTNNEKETLKCGFSWRSGYKGNTQGIVAWGKPIIVKKKDGSKIAVILLDTQGNFDNKETKAKNARVFGMSTFCSSLQIINVMRQIQSNDLEHLQSFVEYSKVPISNRNLDVDGILSGNEKYFQDLLFLVRDWEFNDHQFGNEEGEKYLMKVKSDIKDSSTEESESVMDYLGNTFKNINCYLMPSPSKKVRRGSDVNNLCISDLGEKFCEHVIKLFDEYLNPEKLKVKAIGHAALATGGELFRYVTYDGKDILSGKGPILVSEMTAFADMHKNRCKETMILRYRNTLTEGLKNLESWDEYDKVIERARKMARNQCLKTMRYGNPNLHKEVDIILAESLKDLNKLEKMRMREKREAILEKKIKKWRDSSMAEIVKCFVCLPSEEDLLKNAVTLDKRDSRIAKKLHEKAASEVCDCLHKRRRTTGIITAAAGTGMTAAAVVAFFPAVALCGVAAEVALLVTGVAAGTGTAGIAAGVRRLAANAGDKVTAKWRAKEKLKQS